MAEASARRYAVGGHHQVKTPGHDPDDLEFFPTPPWGTRALCELLRMRDPSLGRLSAWDPCAGAGHMVRPLLEYFRSARGTDIHIYPRKVASVSPVPLDYLGRSLDGTDWHIMNPPFKKLAEFISMGLASADRGVAVLARSQAFEGITRWERIWSKTPPSFTAHFVERLPMRANWLDPTDSTATAYAWFVWERGHIGTSKTLWIPPGTRKRLEREDDYPQEWRRPILPPPPPVEPLEEGSVDEG